MDMIHSFIQYMIKGIHNQVDILQYFTDKILRKYGRLKKPVTITETVKFKGTSD